MPEHIPLQLLLRAADELASQPWENWPTDPLSEAEVTTLLAEVRRATQPSRRSRRVLHDDILRDIEAKLAQIRILAPSSTSVPTMLVAENDGKGHRPTNLDYLRFLDATLSEVLRYLKLPPP